MKSAIAVIMVVITAFFPLLLNSTDLHENIFRKLDLSQYHRVNNVHLRVSNCGFFGEGSSSQLWSSPEFAAGTGADYLFKSAVWVEAKVVRRDDQVRRSFWLPDPEIGNYIVAEGSEFYLQYIDGYGSWEIGGDYLASVSFDGEASIY